MVLFGCYRRGDANDPETYSAAIAATLAQFSQEVVEYVTDPRTGLAGTCEWLPSVFEVRKACMSRADELARRVDFDTRFQGRQPLPRLTYDRKQPGRRANVFVPADNAHHYERCRALAEKADPADWKLDPKGRLGIWIASALFYGAMPAREKWKPAPGDDALRKMYARQTGETTE